MSDVWKINTAFKVLSEHDSRYLLLMGGAGSGKSYSVAQELIRIISRQPNERYLIVRKFYKHIRNSQFKLLTDIVSKFRLPFIVNVSTMSIRNPKNNSEIISIGIDDPEKIKSIADPTGAWCEEMTELSVEDFDQIDLRIRKPGHKLQIIGTYNPIDKSHWIFERFHKEHDIPLGEPVTYDIESYVEVDEVLVPVINKVTVLRTNFKHNKFLPAQYLATLKALEKISPNRFKIYAQGEWGLGDDGFLFSRDFYKEYSSLPSDAVGVIYCDPNLAKKSKGDFTCMLKMYYSPSVQKYFIGETIVRSFSDSNEWLDTLLKLRSNDSRVKAIGFDGSVSQESHWTQHIRNYSTLHKIPMPVIEYKAYKVDDLAKNAQWLWAGGDILFPKGFEGTADGERFLTQFFGFAGKKNSKGHDDAPDALICSIEFLFERGYKQRATKSGNDEFKQRLI